MNNLPASAPSARKLGSPTYFTGKPCKRGHVCERRADNYTCVDCMRTPEALERARRYQKSHAEEHKIAVKKWERTHPRRRNAIRCHYAGKNRAGGSCSCCTEKQFIDFYETAAISGFEVDHVLALSLGGVHCCNNLQMLTHKEHAKKTTHDRAAARQLREAA